jgi:hypothetical protein
MKLSVPFMLLTALLVAGCARPVVRETVVERPVIVDRPVAVERAAAAGATLPSCTYASLSYSHGSLSCQDRSEFRCNNGNWERTINAC